MTWNYQIIRHAEPDGEFYLAIHEVYRDDNGKAYAVTAKPVTVDGESLEEIKSTLEMMLRDCRYPVVDYESIPEPGAESGEGDESQA